MSGAEGSSASSRTVGGVLRGQARRRPDDVALRDPTSSYTYARLLDQASRIGGGFRAAGVGRGDRVLLMLDNHADAVLAWLGLACIGAVEVPLNTALVGDLLSYVVRDSGATTIVIDGEHLDRLPAIREAIGPDARVVTRAPEAVSEAVPFHDLGGHEPAYEESDPSDLAAIFYTSGTTGASKGVLIHEAHAYGYAEPSAMGVATPDDVVFVTLPLFHVGGQIWGVYNALVAGATAYVSPRFSASTFWEEIASSEATFTTLTGAMATFLMAQPRTAAEAANGLRKVGIAPVPSNIAGLCQRFGVTYCTGYGSTEASQPLCAPAGGTAPNSVGWPRPEFEVRLVDSRDRAVEIGEVGELVVRHREPWSLMGGYLNHPEATAEAWRNLWFHTGDAMYRSREGEFFFVDRVRDAIRRRGENISTLEVEAAIRSHPSVADAAVIGVPSEHLEDEVMAVVEPASPGLAPVDLIEFLVGRLPYFMVPRYVRLMAELPRTASSKTRKDPLRAEGVTADTWDREAAGIRVTRTGLTRAARSDQP